MSQHFLLSREARTLSLAAIMRMTDDAARDTFKRIRWAATDGEPFCPHCGCLTVYTLAESHPVGNAAVAGASSRLPRERSFTPASCRFAITSP
jgi:hypothetical protein